jgi:hypothetical protein
MKSIGRLVFALTLYLLVFTPSILAAALPSYQPSVTPGQWAEYKPLYGACPPAITTLCQSSGVGFLGADYGSVQVVDVAGENVTLKLVMIYTNGSSVGEGALVNVYTGESNITSLNGSSSDYFVLAGGLQAHDKIWNATTSPTFNQTISETVLGGAPRVVNFLNYTSSYSFAGYPAKVSTGFAFDQESGILIELSITISSSRPYPFYVSLAIGMVNNNIWLTPGPPDFSMRSSGSISFQGGSSGSSTITITPKNGFSSTINLQVTSPSGIACMLSKASLPGYGSFTVTCRGEPGTYAANVTATSGSTTHSIPVSVGVSADAPNQPSNNFMMLLVYAGIGVAIVAVGAAYMFLRRKPARPTIAPTGTTAPPPAP